MPGQRQTLSRRLFSAVLLAALAILPGAAHAFDVCDNKLDIEHGESAGPFFGMEYAMIKYALAEKFCGASAKPMASRFLGYVEKQGCGPETPIYTELAESITKLEKSDLELLAKGGDLSLELSPEDVQEWARGYADEFGGCTSLVEDHDMELE